jgi:hypothetical protein
MYAYATITVVHRDVWTLPAAAVVTEGEENFCYRFEEGKAVRMPIRVGIRESKVVEVLAKQAKPATSGKAGAWEDFRGDEEIISGDAKALKDGQKVTVSQRREPSSRQQGEPPSKATGRAPR